MTLEAVSHGRGEPLSSSAPAAVHVSPAALELAGEARAPNLTINTNTRVEFDGFVWNSMTVQPTKANIARLSLVVTMPAVEGSFFVTTSGGWNLVFWRDARISGIRSESSLTSLAGNFVPSIFSLTDSERGFSVFADNEKGVAALTRHSPQELRRHDDDW